MIMCVAKQQQKNTQHVSRNNNKKTLNMCSETTPNVAKNENLFMDNGSEECHRCYRISLGIHWKGKGCSTLLAHKHSHPPQAAFQNKNQ